MLDIDKLATSILKTISKPIKKLADRIKYLEDVNNKVEPIVLDLMKYVGLIDNLSKRVDAIAATPLLVNGIDHEQLYSADKIRDLVTDLIGSQKKDEDDKFISIKDAKILIEEIVAKRIAEIKLPEIPEIDLPDIPAMVEELFNAHIEALPIPKDGTSVTVDDVKPVIEELIKKEVSEIEIVLPDFASMVAKEVETIPKPQDGKSVTIEDVRPIIENLISNAVAEIPVPKDGKDGVGACKAVIDRNGHLVLTFTNGEMANLGPVVGKDVDMEAVERMIQEKVDAIPKPKDGVDGLSLDDLVIEFDGERTYTWKLQSGNNKKEFSFKHPNTIYRNVYQPDKSYDRGDLVTWGGSMWHCNKDNTKSKPGEDNFADWTLATKRGRNGKETVIIPRDPKKPVKKD